MSDMFPKGNTREVQDLQVLDTEDTAWHAGPGEKHKVFWLKNGTRDSSVKITVWKKPADKKTKNP